MGSRLAATWLVMIVLHVACGRFGFEEQGSTAIDARFDGSVASGDGAAGPDAKPDAAGVPPDAIMGCGYTACGQGKVTCCDSGTPACVFDTAPCGSRFECEQPTSVGCTGGLQCCITMDSMGTECVDVLTEPCFG